MADFPDGVYSPRTKANKAGVVYDPAKTTIGYVEDVTKLDDEVVAIETELGTNPKGIFASVKAFLAYLYDITQSRAKVYQNAVDQTIETSIWTRVLFDAKFYDSLGEMNVATVAGTAEDLAGANLKDTGIFTEDASYYTVMWAWNTTDNTYTTVTGKTSNDVLTLADDIFDVGETYILYASRFTAKKAGYYQIAPQVRWVNAVDQAEFLVSIWVNGVIVSGKNVRASGASAFAQSFVDTVYLAIGHWADIQVLQASGVNKNILSDSRYTFVTIGRNA